MTYRSEHNLSEGENKRNEAMSTKTLLLIGVTVLILIILGKFRRNLLRGKLMATARDGHESSLKRLLGKGVNPNARSRYWSWTALMYASLNGHVECVRLLIENGAEVNVKSRSNWRFVFAGHTEFAYGIQYRSGRTALMNAALRGHADIAQILLAKGADVNAKTSSGWTALMAAAAMGHGDVVRILCEKGADVKTRDKDYGVTALRLATDKGHDNIVEILKHAAAEE